MTDVDVVAVAMAPLELGEGARWFPDGPVQVDLLAGRLLAHRAGSVVELLSLGIPLGVAAPRGGGGLLVAAGVGVLLLDMDGLVEHTIDTGADPSLIRVNDGIVDADGRFWFGLMPYDGTPGQGSLWRLDADLSLHCVVEQITVPNGPALSPDGTVLYLADSAAGVIFCHSVDRDTGDLGPGHPFAHVSDASPDGLAVDSDGGVWCALWGGGRLHRYSPEGVLERVIALPVQQPTSVALSPDGGAALVTSAAHGLTQAGHLDGRSLWVEVGATGVTAEPFG